MSLDLQNVCVVMGTRPEAIKLAPVIRALQKISTLRVSVVASGQHREMLQQVLAVFGIETNENLDVMRLNQDLCGLSARLLEGFSACLDRLRPRVILVQGDTTTAYAAAVAGFYRGTSVGHVEAGLRTPDRRKPFPEEMNRRLISRLSEWHFAPTNWAAANLINEGIPREDVVVTGNTVVDALQSVFRADYGYQSEDLRKVSFEGLRTVLLTTHRRESFGQRMRDTLGAVRELVERRKDIQVVFPVHLNPSVQEAARESLDGLQRVHLLPPLDYLDFVHLMSRCHFIISDSGGVQEEAPSFGKPVLVLRDDTERPEAVQAGTAVLVGTDPRRIISESLRLLDDGKEYARRSRLQNPFGDGKASQRIVQFLASRLSQCHTERQK